MYTINCNSTDPSIGFAALNASVARLVSSVAGFSTAGVPGFDAPDGGTFATYRRISAHPTVALVMGMVTAPILASTWGWGKRKGTPAHVLDFVREMLEPMRTKVLTHGLTALTFGFAAFENIWEKRGNRVVLARMKPLLPEITQMVVDDHGNLQGVRNQPPGMPARDLLGRKVFVYTNDGDCQNYYGRSRHENVRVTYSQAMQTAERLAQYQKKIAGVIAQLHYPEGTSRDAAGVERSNDWIAQQILEAVSMGRSVRFPNLFASIDDPTSAAELAGKSQWVLSQFDPGGTDYSPGLLNALAYYDKLLFRGWLRPERVGLDTTHGTRADAQQHSESGVLDSELIDQNFTDAFNRQVVDEVLAMNFGEELRGAVYVDPSPISDQKTDTVKAVLAALLRNNLTAQSVASLIDQQSLLEDVDVPLREGGTEKIEN